MGCSYFNTSTNNSTNEQNIKNPIEIYKNTPNTNSNLSNKVSFRCIYDIKNYDEIQIINDRINGENINQQINSKIKIMNNNKKEELLFKKKFNKLGLNNIDFIIEDRLIDMSYMFNKCLSLKKNRIFFYRYKTSY